MSVPAFRTLLSTSSILALATAAPAAVLTQTIAIPAVEYAGVNGTPGVYSSNTTTVPAALLSITLSGVQRFDKNRGELTGISVTFTDTYRITTVAGAVANGNGATISGPTSFGSDASYASAGASNGSSSQAYETTYGDVVESLTVSTPNATASQQLFPGLLGTGTTSFRFAVQNPVTISASDTGSARIDNRGGSLVVTYTYNATPEPTSLLAIASVAALAPRRRR